jgi:hypothetical protein
VARFAVVAALALVSCALRSGWTVTDARTCAAGSEARVCLVAHPDQSIEAHVGGVALVPGECARAPDGARGGVVTLRVRGGTGSERRQPLLVPRGTTTAVVVVDDRRRLGFERVACDARVR